MDDNQTKLSTMAALCIASPSFAKDTPEAPAIILGKEAPLFSNSFDRQTQGRSYEILTL